ncbi:type VI secretion system Vgr family protein [Corallococcus llansteffanensis]|uniref:Type VI secretion system tip protein VgrG n=1 Tax=Corallococcus llansteffanensis TaxID=2316731 RepID=A0A3A8PZH2_9BACT|nr:type VI secretion system tip protein TssI/VgrG [Corallococcus llansteffanensis]RKH61278.1 type VI secretion system tip protein VgrG [Corallococcus llansteffanensis]
MPNAKSPAFTLQVGALEAESLVVERLRGEEGLSRLYDFSVDFAPLAPGSLDTAPLVGAEALLTVAQPGGTPRHVHGMVRTVESLGPRDGRWRYRARIVPALWRLTQVKRSRIFQGQSVPDILKAVLASAQVEVRVSLHESHAPREYCTQYQETDFDFLSRLMEWEGIFYFFEHSETGHVLVLGDAPSVHEAPPGGAALPLRPEDGRVETGEYLMDLRRVRRLRPGAVHLKDYDFEKPSLDVSGKSKSSEGLEALELYDYPGGYVASGTGKAAARVRIQEATQASLTLEGEGICPRLTSGHLLQVEDDGTYEGRYVVVTVRHHGGQPETQGGREALGGLYHNQFQVMPSSVPFRPRRLTPRHRITGLQTAQVVGPAGEEIHTDAHGRIKVQFHWDRDGQRDEKASCWVRTSQALGGPAWGALILPRIGQEVVVRFLEGDPDRPLVAGSVYNGANATPYALPEEKTKSTHKSASSKGSDGFNELRFEDAQGQEEVFHHAQKDQDLVTENDKGQEVRAFEDLLVKKDRARTVEGNQFLSVIKKDFGVVEGHQTLQVHKNRTTTTQGCHDESVEGNQAVTVGQGLLVNVRQGAMENVGAAKAVSIGGCLSVNVALVYNEATGGARLEEVGGLRSEYVVGSRQESVGGDRVAKVGGDFQTEVTGAMQLTVGKDLKDDVKGGAELKVKEGIAWLSKQFGLQADKMSLIVNGKLILSMEKGGGVKFFAKTLTLDGSDIKFKGSKVKLEAAGSLQDKSVKHQEIKALEEAKLKRSVKVDFDVADPSALAGLKFEMKLPDGSMTSGTMGAAGVALVGEVTPGDCEIFFPGLVDA